MAILFIGRSA
ncbi:41564771-e860-4760-8937-3c5b411d662d [Thermothielavioides terrestris]|uniref:41564771-e860-4760-8937-3c5b411d662d n=1 Tax=Thermothielavioides terrestris TaxID=2587410 RepID=A0A3S4AIB6_9PEZI|nr:41564771-e860-4760-8937-3c5b411d662d [Thermothielavioides terrestris]